MSHRKPSAFRINAHPMLTGQANQSHNQWDWLYQLPLSRWEELIEANLQEETSEENTVFYVIKPGSDLVEECPRDIAMQAYTDVLAGRTAPAGPGPLAAATIKKLQSAGGMRMRGSANESFM